jgi:2-hydroxycyclohexanecarboxyl-CoA dehydrogenase
MKAVLVTGGGGAIGAAICRRFSKGMKVLVADRNRDAAEKVAREVGGQALVFDISRYEEAKAALAGQAIDVLVNNAGWDRFQNFVDTDPKDWEALIDINLRGPLNMHHIVLPQMISRGSGRVINISSDAARVGSSGESVYSACKGGIISFSKTLAREVARQGITVNVVCPGPTDTPILRGFLASDEAGFITGQVISVSGGLTMAG